MKRYPADAWERAMKVQEVILRAMAKRITWWQAAEIIGLSDRSLRRWRGRYEQHGYDGLFDRRRGRPSPKRVPVETVEEVVRLWRQTAKLHAILQEKNNCPERFISSSRYFSDGSAMASIGPMTVTP